MNQLILISIWLIGFAFLRFKRSNPVQNFVLRVGWPITILYAGRNLLKGKGSVCILLDKTIK